MEHAAAPASSSPYPGHPTPLVLIVDDDRITTSFLDRVLVGAGFVTATAHDLGQAREALGSREVSLLLLDLGLPDGSGLDLCARLLSERGVDAPPVIMISGDGDVTTKVKGFEAGAVDFVTKPLAGAEVLARVRTHLRLRAAYESLAELHEERIGRLAASQQSFMPLPADLPGSGFQVCMKQAQSAGGDFYDVIASGNRITDFIVADASGHDLGTSLWTASFKTLLSEYGSILHAPADILRMINGSLRRVLPAGAYFTAIYARLNRGTGKLVLINAGHPSAILVSRSRPVGPANAAGTDGTNNPNNPNTIAVRIIEQDGDLVGIFPDASFGSVEVSVRPGDRFFLYSDGLVEKEGARDEGIASLVTACRETAGLPLGEAVPAIVTTLVGEAPFEDDIVLLGVEV
jgi:sigma-B regulation protein RsbU (phosphoserine phosphatase)